MKRWNARAAARQAADAAPEGERYTIAMGGREVPVPYVASWSSELPDFRVAPEPLLGGKPALFRGSGRRGEGKPVLGKMDVGRQRWCVLKRRCQVCAGRLDGHGWLALVPDGPPIDVPGLGRVSAIREPATCTPCLALSLGACPGLRGMPGLRVCRPVAVTIVETLTTPPLGGFGPLVEGGPELVGATLAGAVTGYFKQVVERTRAPVFAEDFLAQFGAGKAVGLG
jgi:hypothetical protein